MGIYFSLQQLKLKVWLLSEDDYLKTELSYLAYLFQQGLLVISQHHIEQITHLCHLAQQTSSTIQMQELSFKKRRNHWIVSTSVLDKAPKRSGTTLFPP